MKSKDMIFYWFSDGIKKFNEVFDDFLSVPCPECKERMEKDKDGVDINFNSYFHN